MKPINVFQYCPRCKSKIKILNDRLIECGSCGLNFYLSPYLSNAAILENDNQQILLVKRKSPPKKGWWDLPGGFVENDETVEQSVRREIKEELGVKIDNICYVLSTTDYYLYRGINYPTVCMIFSAKAKAANIVPQDDITGYEYFPKKRIPYAKIAFKGLVLALKRYLHLSPFK